MSYRSLDGSTVLHASLDLPAGNGPHPGVVLLSIAGTRPLVDRLTGEGYAVLAPTRRGFVDVEPLLRATFSDLAGDVLAALGYLGSRAELDGGALALVAQAEDAPAAILAVAGSREPVPLILLAPPVRPGVEIFVREQLRSAERAGAGPRELEALGDYVARIAEIVVSDEPSYAKEYRLRRLRAGASVQLPRSAAFPGDGRQAHFFASPLWHDRLTFDPEQHLTRLRSPVLVLVGRADAQIPIDDYREAVERGFSGAPTSDAAVRVLPGRTRHAFTEASVSAIVDWLDGRLSTR